MPTCSSSSAASPLLQGPPRVRTITQSRQRGCGEVAALSEVPLCLYVCLIVAGNSAAGPASGEAVSDKDGNGTKRSLGPASSPYMMPYLTGRYKLSPGTVRHHTPNPIRITPRCE